MVKQTAQHSVLQNARCWEGTTPMCQKLCPKPMCILAGPIRSRGRIWNFLSASDWMRPPIHGRWLNPLIDSHCYITKLRELLVTWEVWSTHFKMTTIVTQSVSSKASIGAFACLRPESLKKLQSRAREHAVTVSKWSGVQDGLWLDQSCPLPTLTHRLEPNDHYSLRIMLIL